ncbi:MAG: Rieske 2Fe-2S domain-containing protein [Candidatus Limnocylindrales bacterium]
MGARVMPIPTELALVGTEGRPFTAVSSLDELTEGSLRRFTAGDSDYLVAHTERGICVTDDRCPHMSAPLSIGTLDGCVVACPLHKGTFDLHSGDVVQFPTTGGLDADGGYHAPWSPPGATTKDQPTDLKAQARALTRTRRLRYYEVRISGNVVEARLPEWVRERPD